MQFNLIHIDATESVRERNMAYVSEILFVDPSVDDIETILRGLRPGVEAKVLYPATPAARQIAQALEGFQDLDAVHVIAHGAPGRVSFAAGEWSAETFEHEAEDFAAIGRALAVDGELRLWSCDAAAGAAGAAFIKALAEATGADVAASTGRIGAAALGGNWKLTASSRRPAPQPPLTPSGISAYVGTLPTTGTIAGSSTPITIYGTYSGLTTGDVYFILADLGGTVETIGEFVAGTSSGTIAVTVDLPPGTYTWDTRSGSSNLTSRPWNWHLSRG